MREPRSSKRLAEDAQAEAGYWDDTLRELEQERNKARAEVKQLRDFQERVLAAAEQWKERGYLYEACGRAVDDLVNGGDGYV